ncbi:hypothetical protein LVY75_28605 [Sinorhizobium sp. B11]
MAFRIFIVFLPDEKWIRPAGASSAPARMTHLQAVTLRLQLPHAGRNKDFAPVRRNMGRFGNK